MYQTRWLIYPPVPNKNEVTNRNKHTEKRSNNYTVSSVLHVIILHSLDKYRTQLIDVDYISVMNVLNPYSSKLFYNLHYVKLIKEKKYPHT
jgi:hypothetical protein